MSQPEHIRPRVWPGFAAAALAGVIGIGGAVTGAFIGGIYNADNTVATITFNAGAAAGRDCLTYQTWVTERITAGLDDAAIVTLSMAAIEASSQLDTVAPTAQTSAIFSSATTAPPVPTAYATNHYWTACGYNTQYDIALLVVAIRSSTKHAPVTLPPPPPYPLGAYPTPS